MNDQFFAEIQFVSPNAVRRAYYPPRLSLLGDVCKLTETGSMAGMESPLNWCWVGINMDYNSCKP